MDLEAEEVALSSESNSLLSRWIEGVAESAGDALAKRGMREERQKHMARSIENERIIRSVEVIGWMVCDRALLQLRGKHW